MLKGIVNYNKIDNGLLFLDDSDEKATTGSKNKKVIIMCGSLFVK